MRRRRAGRSGLPVRSQTWFLDPGQRVGLFPCEYLPEVPGEPGAVPHYLPGANPYLREYANWYRLPYEGTGPPDFTPIALNPREGTQGRSLEVVTTNLRPGYLRKNGIPYSARTTLREYFALSRERNGDTWFVVTTIVEDPEYLTTPFVTSTNFRKQADASGWSPTTCAVR